MKTDRSARTPAFTLLMACAMAVSATAASSTALSNRTVVDTRDPFPVIALLLNMSQSQVDGRNLIRFETIKQSLSRPTAGSKTVYLQLDVPTYAAKLGGIGLYYGLEVNALPIISETLQYKVGGSAPSANTPASEWKSAPFNSIVNMQLNAGRHYFKIVLQPQPAIAQSKMDVNVRFKAAKFYNSLGANVGKLDASKPLWIVCHGKNDGERSFRTMREALSTAAPGVQVVAVDWASGADGGTTQLNNGRYFINLAQNLSTMLKRDGFTWTRVNWSGHSWGTLVGYETARAFGGIHRFIALDPATQAGGGYDDTRVKFKEVTYTSTAVKGGGFVKGLYGSEDKAKSCDFSMRLLSESHSGDGKDRGFFHSLPRDWYIRALKQGTNDPHWPYFNGVVMRQKERPDTPWAEINPGGLSGFDLECNGMTYHDDAKDDVRFFRNIYLLYESKNPPRRNMEARRGADNKWTVVKH